jgi:hypothetical protein
MPVTHLAGAEFTVKIGATDYTAQITEGSIERTANVVKTKTLGPNTVATQTDREDSLSVSLLYDEESGLYKALHDATDSLSAVAVEIVGGGGKWTSSSMSVSSLSAQFNAEDVASCSATLEGLLAFAAVV